jgi:hypothetical protein
VHHVTQEIGLFALKPFRNGHVRQEAHLKHIERRTLPRCSSSTLGLPSSTDKVQRGVPILDGKRLLDAWPEHFEHRRVIRVETDVAKDISVRDDSERAKDDNNGNVHLDVGQLDVEDRAGSRTARCSGVQSDLHLADPPGPLEVARHGGVEGERGLFLEDVDLVESHTLLGDEDLLRTLDDEVAARVVWALAELVEMFGGQVMQQTEVRPSHDWNLSSSAKEP